MMREYPTSIRSLTDTDKYNLNTITNLEWESIRNDKLFVMNEFVCTTCAVLVRSYGMTFEYCHLYFKTIFYGQACRKMRHKCFVHKCWTNSLSYNQRFDRKF